MQFDELTAGDLCKLDDLLGRDQFLIDKILELAAISPERRSYFNALVLEYTPLVAMQKAGGINVGDHIMPVLVMKHGREAFRGVPRLHKVAARLSDYKSITDQMVAWSLDSPLRPGATRQALEAARAQGEYKPGTTPDGFLLQRTFDHAKAIAAERAAHEATVQQRVADALEDHLEKMDACHAAAAAELAAHEASQQREADAARAEAAAYHAQQRKEADAAKAEAKRASDMAEAEPAAVKAAYQTLARKHARNDLWQVTHAFIDSDTRVVVNHMHTLLQRAGCTVRVDADKLVQQRNRLYKHGTPRDHHIQDLLERINIHPSLVMHAVVEAVKAGDSTTAHLDTLSASAREWLTSGCVMWYKPPKWAEDTSPQPAKPPVDVLTRVTQQAVASSAKRSLDAGLAKAGVVRVAYASLTEQDIRAITSAVLVNGIDKVGRRMNVILERAGCEHRVDEVALAQFASTMGRPGLPPVSKDFLKFLSDHNIHPSLLIHATLPCAEERDLVNMFQPHNGVSAALAVLVTDPVVAWYHPPARTTTTTATPRIRPERQELVQTVQAILERNFDTQKARSLAETIVAGPSPGQRGPVTQILTPDGECVVQTVQAILECKTDAEKAGARAAVLAVTRGFGAPGSTPAFQGPILVPTACRHNGCKHAHVERTLSQQDWQLICHTADTEPVLKAILQCANQTQVLYDALANARNRPPTLADLQEFACIDLEAHIIPVLVAQELTPEHVGNLQQISHIFDRYISAPSTTPPHPALPPGTRVVGTLPFGIAHVCPDHRCAHQHLERTLNTKDAELVCELVGVNPHIIGRIAELAGCDHLMSNIMGLVKGKCPGLLPLQHLWCVDLEAHVLPVLWDIYGPGPFRDSHRLFPMYCFRPIRRATNELDLPLTTLFPAPEPMVQEEAAPPSADDTTCAICMDRPKARYALVPCGHARMCAQCTDKIRQMGNCPFCRKRITNVQQFID